MSIPVSHFRRRLESFINERHPNLKNAKRLIATRSVQAAQAFSSAVLAGDSETAARTKSDALLFEGLLFSKYDTIRCIIATEFPKIPPDGQRTLSLELIESCNDIFSRYALTDRLIREPAFNHMIVELTERIKTHIDRNDLG